MTGSLVQRRINDPVVRAMVRTTFLSFAACWIVQAFSTIEGLPHIGWPFVFWQMSAWMFPIDRFFAAAADLALFWGVGSMAVSGSMLVVQIVRQRRAAALRASGACAACGYSLRDLGSDRCPECGSMTGPAAPLQLRRAVCWWFAVSIMITAQSLSMVDANRSTRTGIGWPWEFWSRGDFAPIQAWEFGWAVLDALVFLMPVALVEFVIRKRARTNP
jgi:hypothetical protein